MRSSIVLVLSISLFACGGSEPEPQTPQNDAPPPERAAGPELQVQSELGSIDQKDADSAMNALHSRWDGCQRQRLGDVGVISGKVSLFVRLGSDGKPLYAYFEQSELGDRETERCMLDAVMSAAFPKPEGGEQAEIHHNWSLVLPEGTRAPDAWDASKMEEAQRAASRCSGASSAQVTAYVENDEDAKPRNKRGKVVAVGVALPQQNADDTIECIVKAVKDAKVPSPGDYVAKVSFTL